MKIERHPEAGKRPTGFIAACIGLAVVSLLTAVVFLRSGDRTGYAGILVAAMLGWFAYAAHRRAKAAPGLTITVDLDVPENLPVVPMRVGPLYTLFETTQSVADMGAWWSGGGHAFRDVVGFTSLGAVFLRDARTGVYGVLWPFKDGNNLSSLEACASVEEFERRFLKDREHSPIILDPIKVASLRRTVGPLEPGQVYIPVPYPFIAGERKDTVYERGEFWAFINLCGQMRAQFRS